MEKLTDSDNSAWPAGIKVRPFYANAPQTAQRSQRSSPKRTFKGKSFRRDHNQPRNQPFHPRSKQQHGPFREYIDENRFAPYCSSLMTRGPYYDYEAYYDAEWPKLGYSPHDRYHW